MKSNIFIPVRSPAKVELPGREIYFLMGEENIFKMLEDFYLELEKCVIRDLFSKDIVAA